MEPNQDVKANKEVADAVNSVGKKKVGRPKKDRIDTHITFNGIQDAPKVPEDVMELVYDNPQIFKKIIQIFTSYQAAEIEMSFDRNGVKMFAPDHNQQSNIYVILDGRGMNHYYCKEPLRICVKCSLLDAVFQTIGKTHYKIMFVCRDDYRSKLYCVTNSSTHENSKTYDIPVIINPPVNRPNDDDTEYPIKFTLSAAGFKDLINPRLGSTITIEKRGTEALQLVYDKVNQLGCIDRYPVSDKINLESKIGPDEIFSASICVKYVRSLASKNIGSTIQIAAHKTKKMSFTAYSGRRDDITVATVKVFTEIK